MTQLNVLLIDNFDSFSHNLVDEFAKRDCNVLVYRNNAPMQKIREVIAEQHAELIVISPGPSNPANAGNCIPIIKEFSGKLPIFGVCLGLQCMVEAFGGKVSKCIETFHGKPSKIFHDNKTIFSGIPQGFQAGRYHSLASTRTPAILKISAKTESGIVMGLRHKKFFVEGVQFHPESILTPEGGKIIENIISMAKEAKQGKA